MDSQARSRKRAVIHLSMQTLHHLLRLPSDMTLLHLAPDAYGLSLAAVVTAPDMADVEPNAYPPEAVPEILVEHGRIVGFGKVEYPREVSE